MRGNAATGWSLLLGALALAVVISIGLYNWDTRARQAEASLRPEPLAPLAAASPTAVLTASIPQTVPISVAGGDAAAGQATFQSTCNGCHPNANAGIGPALNGPAFSTRYPDNSAIAAVVRSGRGAMPAFSQTLLSDSDLTNVIAYLRSLSGGAPVAAAATAGASPAAAPTPLSQQVLSSITPGLSTFMLETAKRMGRSWFAGQANNWDEAAFEVREARGVLQAGAARSNASRQQVIGAFNDAVMTPLATAAQSGDQAQYQQAYRAAIQACNACHAAQPYGPTGGNLGFIRVQVPNTSIWDVYAYAK